MPSICQGGLLVLVLAASVFADPPETSYIFPAGGRRGDEVKVRVGGLYLHDCCSWGMLGPGVKTSPNLERTKTTWFEGPVIPLPDSQRQENYPKDMAGTVTISDDAPPGLRAWHAWTSQGACSARVFVVGELPEVIEDEIDGQPIPVPVELPVTINGRIFPREDVDVWSFTVKAGRPVTCAVLSKSLGSPLKARVEILDPDGRRVAESSPAPFSDAFLRFVPDRDGTYLARIHDQNFGGLQPYVYRLTVTAGPWVDRVEPAGGQRGTTALLKLFGQSLPTDPVPLPLPGDGGDVFWTRLEINGQPTNVIPLHLGDAPEESEPAPGHASAVTSPAKPPVVLNGAIESPGDVDDWPFMARKGDIHRIEIRAREFGSRLDAALAVVDSRDKQLSTSDSSGILFTAPDDGIYRVQVRDQFASRGGADFGYRLRIAPPEPQPRLRLELLDDTISVPRGGEAKLKVLGAHPTRKDAEIRFDVEGLPEGVTFTSRKINGSTVQHELAFKAEPTARVGAVRVSVRGSVSEPDQSATAVFRTTTRPAVEIDTLLVSVAVPTPYQVKGTYEVKYAQRGGPFTRHFRIERNGFEGPLTISLGDRQARHLQGVTGPTILVPADQSEFDYTIFLPPWMEIGRTSRTVIMAVGQVVDPDGSKHTVSFTSVAQNEQMVALVDPGQLGIDLDQQSLLATPGETRLNLRVNRGVAVHSPVTVELVVPEHIRGISATPLTIPADQTEGTLVLRFASQSIGPLNMPLTVRARARKNDEPVVAESRLEIVELQVGQ